jgi:hypothetical protein
MTPRDPISDAAAQAVYTALGAQCADLVDARSRLARLRRRLPLHPEGWRGPAAVAFGVLAGDLERRVESVDEQLATALGRAQQARWSLADRVG